MHCFSNKLMSNALFLGCFGGSPFGFEAKFHDTLLQQANEDQEVDEPGRNDKEPAEELKGLMSQGEGESFGFGQLHDQLHEQLHSQLRCFQQLLDQLHIIIWIV